MFISKQKTFTTPFRGFPAFLHLTFGLGIPSALHLRFASFPSITLTELVLWSSIIVGDTTTIRFPFWNNIIFIHVVNEYACICTLKTIGSELTWHMYTPASFCCTSFKVRVQVFLSLCLTNILLLLKITWSWIANIAFESDFIHAT